MSRTPSLIRLVKNTQAKNIYLEALFIREFAFQVKCMKGSFPIAYEWLDQLRNSHDVLLGLPILLFFLFLLGPFSEARSIGAL